jgi:uncharacterized protein YneR
LVFNFALECDIRKAQENGEVKFSIKNHLLVYAGDVDLLVKNNHEEEHRVFVRRPV